MMKLYRFLKRDRGLIEFIIAFAIAFLILTTLMGVLNLERIVCI